MMTKVVQAHETRLPETLLPLQRTYEELQAELLHHMAKEDRELFPESCGSRRTRRAISLADQDLDRRRREGDGSGSRHRRRRAGEDARDDRR